uniref:Uncharacterized protein n=1 Tax=Arundo donax TaxID=35708 RepID=A0A0A9BG92_ARUDO
MYMPDHEPSSAVKNSKFRETNNCPHRPSQMMEKH